MEIFVLHILKLNIIAAVIILLVKPLAILFKGQVSARWKYIIWLLITVSLCIPVRLPANFTLVDFKVQRSIQQNEQNSKTTDYAARPGERQQKMEIMSSVNNNTKSQSEVPEQKEFIVHTAGKWLETIAVIFASVWLSVAVLKLAGELLAYYLSMKNLRRMSLPVNDSVSIQMYRDVCRKKSVRRAPELRQNAGLTTPLLAGLFHTTIYWFNPFLLIMLKEADKDIENLCDTAVINRVNKKDHRLYRQLLLRTVAMNNQIPYVTASLNDSGMVFKDRILYMVNIRKLRRGILPGILVTVLLAGSNLVFNVSAGTDTAPTRTERTGQEKNTDPEEKNAPDYAPFSEMIDMQKIAGTQSETGVSEDTNTEASVNSGENISAETNSDSTVESNEQESETTDNGSGSDSDGSGSYYESLPAGVPYTSGFSTPSGVASIVASGEGDEESRVLYDNGDGTYSDDNGFQYSYQGDGNWADANGNSYRTWNDEDYNLGTKLGQHELQGSGGSVDVKETTNGDYYYCDANGVGYTDNGDGTWTDENGNSYTE